MTILKLKQNHVCMSLKLYMGRSYKWSSCQIIKHNLGYAGWRPESLGHTKNLVNIIMTKGVINLNETRSNYCLHKIEFRFELWWGRKIQLFQLINRENVRKGYEPYFWYTARTLFLFRDFLLVTFSLEMLSSLFSANTFICIRALGYVCSLSMFHGFGSCLRWTHLYILWCTH